MSRRQDLVLARLRLLALRWRGAEAPVRAQTRAAGAVDTVELPREGAGILGSADGRPRRTVGVSHDVGPVHDPQSPTEGGASLGRSHESDAPPPSDLHPADVGWPGGGESSERTPLRIWLVLLVALVVIVVAVVGFTVARSWPRTQVQVATPAESAPAAVVPSTAEPSTGAAPSAGAPTAAAASSLVVHVVGDVKHPGVVVLPAGSRVADALAAAGGLRRGGSVGATNLARVLGDGERIEIGADSDVSSATGNASGSGAGATIVDLNTATADQLDSLPGVGPVTAAKILAWRSAHGRFSIVDELAEVPGIGPKTLEELRPHVRV